MPNDIPRAAHTRASPSLTVAEKLESGGFLALRREFCPWSGLCATMAYREIAAGRLRATKLGSRTMIAAQDALAWRDLKRGLA